MKPGCGETHSTIQKNKANIVQVCKWIKTLKNQTNFHAKKNHQILKLSKIWQHRNDNCHHASIFLGYLSFGLPIIIGSKTYHRALTHQDLKDEDRCCSIDGLMGNLKSPPKKWDFQQKNGWHFWCFSEDAHAQRCIFVIWTKFTKNSSIGDPRKKTCGLWDLWTKILVPYVVLLFHSSLRFEKQWLDEKQRIHQIAFFESL